MLRGLVAAFAVESAHVVAVGALRLDPLSDPQRAGEDLADRQVRSGGDSWNGDHGADLQIAVIKTWVRRFNLGDFLV